MALDPLASADDLAARNIVAPDGVDVDAILNAVSDAIRNAAGVPIARATSTVVIPVYVPADQWLTLPGAPVVSVATVLIDGDAVTDFTKVGDDLYRACGWGIEPCEVTVTYTHGYLTVPADIIDLVCSFASLAFTASEGDYGMMTKTQEERLGDYQVMYDRPISGEGIKSPSPVDIPEGTRQRLRARFLGSADTVSFGRG